MAKGRFRCGCFASPPAWAMESNPMKLEKRKNPNQHSTYTSFVFLNLIICTIEYSITNVQITITIKQKLANIFDDINDIIKPK
jgi:hypothetical protein